MRMTSARSSSAFWDERFEPPVSQLLGSFADDLHAHGQLVAKCAKRGEVGDDVSLAIGGARPYQRPLRSVSSHTGLVHAARPAVAARRGGSTAAPSATRVAPPRGRRRRRCRPGCRSRHVLQARSGERREQPFDHAGAFGGRELRRVVHGSERDHLRQVALGLRHKGFDLVAERFGGHAVFLPIGLARGRWPASAQSAVPATAPACPSRAKMPARTSDDRHSLVIRRVPVTCCRRFGFPASGPFRARFLCGRLPEISLPG